MAEWHIFVLLWFCSIRSHDYLGPSLLSITCALEWDCPHLVPSSGCTWGYFNDAGWVTANFGDILVQCHMDSEGSESKIINENSSLNPFKFLPSIFFIRNQAATLPKK